MLSPNVKVEQDLAKNLTSKLYCIFSIKWHICLKYSKEYDLIMMYIGDLFTKAK